MVSRGSEQNRPRIGVTMYLEHARWGVWDRPAALVPQVYLDAVVGAGGTPLLLPPRGTDVSVVDMLDGLLVIGGADVDPDSYGAQPHPTTTSHPERDAHELTLLRAAVDRGMPVLAVCRGAQLLNVLYGGTLHQHLPEVVDHSDHQPSPGVFGPMSVRTEPGSRVAQILGSQTDVPCYHHQALDRIGTGLRVTATAQDGTAEAVESNDDRWLLGVQWHPEENQDDLRLFESHVEAARERPREAVTTRRPAS